MASAVVGDRLLALKARLAGQRSTIAFQRFLLAFERRYSEDQPRVPAGEPGAGQWTEGGDEDSPDASIIPVGGFSEGQLDMTVQGFMSTYCQGRIRAEIPGQFLDMRIRDVQSLKQDGDQAAAKCIKILGQDRFRK